MPRAIQAVLRLDNNHSFSGQLIGYPRPVAGEVVFNTGMVGYPESLTDPSYYGQILVLTFPLIGNYGVPSTANPLTSGWFESSKIQVAGLILGDYSTAWSHWNAKQSLADWLHAQRIPALTGVDTRRLTMLIREHGVMDGAIRLPGRAEPVTAFPMAQAVASVSTKKVQRYRPSEPTRKLRRIVVIDCGVKLNIIRSLLVRGCEVIRVPHDYPVDRFGTYDGVVISNGPGDPTDCASTVKIIRRLLDGHRPILGICLGCQLLALAAGGATFKLPYGHRSQNQPCLDLTSGRCFITSQNHGYTVRPDSLGQAWAPWFTNANDGTLEGFRHRRQPWLAVQFHPEAHPGPEDTSWIIDRFLALV